MCIQYYEQCLQFIKSSKHATCKPVFLGKTVGSKTVVVYDAKSKICLLSEAKLNAA